MIGTEAPLPIAPRLMLKADWGSLPVPRLLNGPLRLSEIGPLSVLEPEGTTIRLNPRLPLLIWCLPVKV